MSRLHSWAGEEGFSLVELMIVALIIGVLVSIATASFVVSIRASKKTACKANLRVIREEITAYQSKHDENPPVLQDLFPEFIQKENHLRCPTTHEVYDYDPASGEVSCPYHTDN